jgi:alpha-1,3-mannosyl-glycoprotein beta-1,2-N-acetylglucosaminyltransferase
MQLRPVPLLDVESMDSPVLIITCKRANYLEKTLWNTFQYHPAQQHAASNAQRNGNLKNTRTNHDSAGKAGRILGTPIIVSVDGKNSEVQSVIDAYRQLFELKLGVPLYQIQHPPPGIEKKRQYNPGVDWVDPYKLIAAHLGWALDQTFSGAYSKHQKHYRQIPTPPLPRRVVVLEEDIEIAHDFFSLMNATADLLDSDDTLLAVSGFNDNGYEQLVADPKRLVRSDFFPGLGWMMSRTVWDGPASHPDTGLNRNWAPNGFWDDWLRESDIRRGRQIIRPEISRSFHFGNVDGASTGNKVNEKLNKIKLEENSIHWEDLDLSHLAASSFADNYWNRVSRAKSVKNVDDAKRYVADGDVRLVYYSFYQFGILASQFEIMQDEKAGVPRTGYEGIVEIRYGRGNFVIFLTPKYVDEIHKPEHFGMRAWMKSSKESLMRDLGIQNIHSEVKPDLKT